MAGKKQNERRTVISETKVACLLLVVALVVVSGLSACRDASPEAVAVEREGTAAAVKKPVAVAEEPAAVVDEPAAVVEKAEAADEGVVEEEEEEEETEAAVGEEPVAATFPDTRLEAAIRKAINRPEGPILRSDLAELSSLDLSSSRISDLSGLQYCANLTRLNLSSNSVTDLSPLANLTGLIYLNLTHNSRLSDVSPLSNLADLAELVARFTDIADISSLSGLTNLTKLDLYSNDVGDISALSDLVNLTKLDLTHNSVSDISPLSNLINLTDLDLGDNQISDVSPVANLVNLIDLNLHRNEISDISPLSEESGLAEGLETLTLTSNPLATRSATSVIAQFEQAGVTVYAPPTPGAVVVASALEMREGPGRKYPAAGQLSQGDELLIVGRSGDCDWLKVSTSEQVTGWVFGSSSGVELWKPCSTIPGGTFRPFSGVVMPSTRGRGKGELTIENGTASDGVAILALLAEEPVMAAYVRAGESFTMTGIRDGTYYLFFSTGSEWDGEASKFTESPRYKRFDDQFGFSTSDTQYTIYSVTLHGVAGGTAGTETLDDDQFPNIGD